MKTRHNPLSQSFIVLCSLVALGGCVVDSVEMNDEDIAAQDADEIANDADEENVASTEQAIYLGWTSWTSEEFSPVVCDSGSLIASFQCSGWYCDNVRAYCLPANAGYGGSYWTSYFSEEGTNHRFCNSGYWMTGIACNGWYCDNISIQCSYVGNLWPNSCYWTGWVSEEYGNLDFGWGYYARGVQCDGSYCDNKRFYVCRG